MTEVTIERDIDEKNNGPYALGQWFIDTNSGKLYVLIAADTKRGKQGAMLTNPVNGKRASFAQEVESNHRVTHEELSRLTYHADKMRPLDAVHISVEG